ncbi:pyridoxamine 5'-phosphate oxidase [Wenjunlia vitaminophila]|uniref:Pyridoxamine 5'-phosphate oxidase n=1 Tax=Wenjunlia vitaminophila TaxID=76728 RepID=A0A0T6LYT7_WENVI|nr:PPOX class F420-dependent oxidoreductase [Wenjunlia vitaminophila]KRV51145.1 pyridoxamine 5'-phosphate oxidase [Wenjunlia vitaminophila]
MATALPEALRNLVDEPVFATLATIQPDGSPQVSVVWVKRDGDDVLFSTVEGRRKHLNVARDPRVSVVLVSPSNPYTYFEVRGTVSLSHEGARELIDELARKYLGAERYEADGPDDVRVVARVTPRKVVSWG